MAEETDLSRTEPASPRRLHEARKAGDVPRSAELSGWLVLLAALGVLSWQAQRLLGAARDMMAAAFTHAARPGAPFLDAVQTFLWAALPVLVAIFVAALVAPMLLSGPVFAPKVTQPQLARANPFKPFARFFSIDALVDGALALLKLVLVVAAGAWALSLGWADLQTLAVDESFAAMLPAVSAWVLDALLALVAALAVIAALDAGWRWWRYLRRHAMTWQDVLAEAREAEGSPEMRAQVRARQQQAGQGRRIDEVIG
jgi:flagellar biosynthetic protein FlhB